MLKIIYPLVEVHVTEQYSWHLIIGYMINNIHPIVIYQHTIFSVKMLILRMDHRKVEMLDDVSFFLILHLCVAIGDHGDFIFLLELIYEFICSREWQYMIIICSRRSPELIHPIPIPSWKILPKGYILYSCREQGRSL